MSWRDWVKNVRWTANNESLEKALWAAGQELWQGFLRRSAGWAVTGTPIWAYDWEVLCIVDGCRLDVISEVGETETYPWLPAEPSYITSAGGNSPEWLNRNFAPEFSEQLQMTGYVTANPFSDPPPNRHEQWPHLPLDSSDFALLREVFKTEPQHEIGDGGSVAPSDVTKHAIDVWRNREQFGVKRLIVHYMQPHAPFRSRPDWSEGLGDNPWNRLRDGKISAEDLWGAYRDNLHWVLESIDVLSRNCEAKIVLSSDHGNAMGEWGVYGHPPGTPVPAVRRVPWIELAGTDEMNYQPDLDVSCSDPQEDIPGQLEALGYR